MLSLPSQTERIGDAEKVKRTLKNGAKIKEINFQKKLVGLKRSCSFAAAYRDSHNDKNGRR